MNFVLPMTYSPHSFSIIESRYGNAYWPISVDGVLAWVFVDLGCGRCSANNEVVGNYFVSFATHAYD